MTSPIVCIFGSRQKWWKKPKSVMLFVRGLIKQIKEVAPNAIILTGGADGVDDWANDGALIYGMEWDIDKAEWRTEHGYNPSAGHERNSRMAKKCTAAIGVWDGKSPGTRSMIKQLEREKKPYKIYEPEHD